MPIATRLGAGRLGPGSRLLARWGTGRFVAPADAGCALARSAVNLTLVKAAVKQKLVAEKYRHVLANAELIGTYQKGDR